MTPRDSRETGNTMLPVFFDGLPRACGMRLGVIILITRKLASFTSCVRAGSALMAGHRPAELLLIFVAQRSPWRSPDGPHGVCAALHERTHSGCTRSPFTS